MKRKINESAGVPVVIIASKIRKDDPSVDCNDLKDVFVDEGAEVNGEYVDGETRMIVSGLSKAEVKDILDDYLADTNCMFAKDYILEDIIAEEEDAMELECDEPLSESCGRKKYQELVDEDEDLDEDEDIDDLEPLNSDYPAYEDVDINNDSVDRELVKKAYDALTAVCNLGDNITEEYIDDNAYELIEQMGVDPDDLDDDEYDHYIEILKEVFKDNMSDFADYDEMDDEFESYGHIEEKKRGCCPKKTVNENVKIVLDDLKKKHIAAKANQKLMNEQLNSTIVNVSNKMLVEKTKAALKVNKKSLHENVKVNGKSLKNFSIKELKSLYAKLNESIKNLNESKNQTAFDKRVRLMEYIDQEITYRETRLKYINEDASISDDELSNLFGPAQGESDKKAEKPDAENNEADEEVELSRIEITLKDADALKDLKDACIEAEIPEDAFDCEGLEDEEDPFETEEEESDENSEETKEKPEESEEEGDANESIYYRNISRLFEADEEEGEGSEETAVEPADDAETEEDSDENSEEEEEPKYKFILTDTDYTVTLAKVLEDVYGISKEEFEEMIGGEIVEEQPKEDSEEKSDDEHKEDSEEKSEEDDEIDPSELFKGL